MYLLVEVFQSRAVKAGGRGRGVGGAKQRESVISGQIADFTLMPE